MKITRLPKSNKITGKQGWSVFVSAMIDGRGRKRTRVFYGTKKQAVAFGVKLQAELYEALRLDQDNEAAYTLGYFLNMYYVDHCSVSKRDFKTDLCRLNNLIRILGPGKRVENIRPKDIEQYMARRRRDKGNFNKPVARSTISQEVRLLSQAFNWAVDNKLLPAYNPCKSVKLPKETSRRDRVLTTDEFTQILLALPPFYRPLFFWARYTGLRKSALLRLTRVQLKDGIIRRPDHQADTNLYESSKNFGAPPIVDGLLDTITGDRLFARRGRYLRSVQYPMDLVRSKVNIKRWTFHDLRRSYATMLGQMNVEYLLQKVITGHSVQGRNDAMQSNYRIVADSEIREVGRMIAELPEFRAHLAMVVGRALP